MFRNCVRTVVNSINRPLSPKFNHSPLKIGCGIILFPLALKIGLLLGSISIMISHFPVMVIADSYLTILQYTGCVTKSTRTYYIKKVDSFFEKCVNPLFDDGCLSF